MAAVDLSTLNGSSRDYPIFNRHLGYNSVKFIPIKPIYINDIIKLKDIKYKTITLKRLCRHDNKMFKIKNRIKEKIGRKKDAS